MPAVCHSELGVLVVDGCSHRQSMAPNRTTWHHLGCLTRVLPVWQPAACYPWYSFVRELYCFHQWEQCVYWLPAPMSCWQTVSKILLYCYVVPAETGVGAVSPVNFSSYHSLEKVRVRPVTWMNRRHQVSEDIAAQSTVLEMQLKYRRGSVKEKNPRRAEAKSLSEFKE